VWSPKAEVIGERWVDGMVSWVLAEAAPRRWRLPSISTAFYYYYSLLGRKNVDGGGIGNGGRQKGAEYVKYHSIRRKVLLTN